MKHFIQSSTIILLAIATLLSSGCSDDVVLAACDDNREWLVTGVVTRGRTDRLVSGEQEIQIELSSDILISSVHIGSVAATSTSDKPRQWAAKLTQTDLDAAAAGDETANFTVTATDVCGRAHPIDKPLAFVLRVDHLDLSRTLPEGQCFLPMNGSAPAIVDVATSAAAAGTSVFLTASQGKLAGAANTLETKLIGGADDASLRTYFTGAAPEGTTAIYARVGSFSSAPVSVLVAGPPAIDMPPVSQKSGVPVEVRVFSRGTLSMCDASILHTGSATVVYSDDSPTPIDGPTPVPGASGDCSTPDETHVTVTFQSAPAGATVLLRCWDTYGQTSNEVKFVAAE